MSITVKTPSTFSRGGLGSQSSGNTPDEAGVIVCIDSSGKLLVHGKIGSGTTDDPTHRELERYDPGSNTWSTLAASIKYQFGHGWILDASDRIIYAAGKTLVGSTYTNDVAIGEIYDPGADTWTAITTIPAGASAAARHFPYFFKDGSGRLNIIGGLATPIPTNGWVYSGGASGTWTEYTSVQTVTTPKAQRSAGQDVPYDSSNVPWVVEPGRGQGAWLELWKWSGSTLSQLASRSSGNTLGWAGTPAVWASDGLLYLAGGVTSAVAVESKTWTYNPVSNAWTQHANTVRPVAFATLVDFGGYRYLIGGRGAGPTYAPIANISVYDPVANAWTDTADVLSVARALPSVVLDQAGLGFWIYGGTTANWGSNGGYTNVLEYWVPAPPGAVGQGTTFVAIIG